MVLGQRDDAGQAFTISGVCIGGKTSAAAPENGLLCWVMSVLFMGTQVMTA